MSARDLGRADFRSLESALYARMGALRYPQLLPSNETLMPATGQPDLSHEISDVWILARRAMRHRLLDICPWLSRKAEMMSR